MTLEVQTLEVLTLEAPTLEALSKKDIGGLTFKSCWEKHPQEGNICLCEAFVKPVVHEIHVARLNGLRP